MAEIDRLGAERGAVEQLRGRYEAAKTALRTWPCDGSDVPRRRSAPRVAENFTEPVDAPLSAPLERWLP